MLDIKKILLRSWHILWNYRILWVFGFLMALSMTGNNIGDNSRYTMNDGQNDPIPSYQTPDDWEGLHGDTFEEVVDDAFRQMNMALKALRMEYPVEFDMVIAAAITLFAVIFVVSIITAVLRYVAETSIIRMVDEYEQTGVKLGFRQGWKFGWSSASWRLFLINFIIHIPVFVLLTVLVLVGWWIFSAAMSGIESALISSIIAGTGLTFLFIFGTIVLMVVLRVVRDFAWRLAALEGTGVIESLRKAFGLIVRQWKNVGLMWLVMIGIKIAWALAAIILIFPLLIVSIITALGGLFVAIVPTLLTAGVASLLSVPDYWPWIFAAIIGLPFFMIVTFSPVFLVSGWSLIYKSNVWTLTYRELKALETVAPVVAE